MYLLADHIISPLGFNTEANFTALYEGRSSLVAHQHSMIGHFIASKIDRQQFHEAYPHTLDKMRRLTFVEQLCITTLSEAASKVNLDLQSSEVLLVFSTTKGNVELLCDKDENIDRVRLGAMAQMVSKYVKNPNRPIVVSNACISGVEAIIYAIQLLQAKRFKYILVCGVDIVSDFVLAGFSSFQALSSKPCRPFDKRREGLNIGEACVALALSSEKNNARIAFLGGASANDANHLSGPSRTGEGLSLAISKALKEAKVQSGMIQLVSAHGTATPYNDEMEALALQSQGLQNTPLHSLKGYYGHTLGAAGLLESAIVAQSLVNNALIASKGFEELGVSAEVNIIAKSRKENFGMALKTASGFGGGNAALVISKV